MDWAWWRLDVWGAGRPRRKEGEWGEGPSLAITAMFCKDFAYVFGLSISIRKMASEHPFCVLIYMIFTCISTFPFSCKTRI